VDEVRRIAARQLEYAIDGLTATGDVAQDGTVHGARRHIKKVRALTRLVRPAMGARYRGVNHRLRAANRLLAPIADAQASVATLTRVTARDSRALPADAVATLRDWLMRRESIAYEEGALSDVFETVAAVLRAERDAVPDWRLSETGFRAIAGGLERTVRASRRTMARAIASSRSQDYHRWRQRVKDHWLQIRLIQARCGDGLALDERRLDALDGYLGECHNCAILREVLASGATLDRSDAARCLRAVRRYERAVRRHARRLGTAIYSETVSDFLTRVRRLWRSTRPTRRTHRRGITWPSAA
jgi:hypothetical protein